MVDPGASPMHLHHTHHDTDPARGHQGPPVTVRLLGGFAVTVAGRPTPARGWARRSAAAIVKVLALAPGHHLHRELVMDLLWPDEPPDRAAPRLHKAAHYARRAAGHHGAVVLRDDVVWLFPDSELTVDVLCFEQLARVAVADGDAAAARDALAWYRGELLPGDRYEDWAADRRELLALRRLDVLRVAGEWRELAELDQTDEQAHLELVRRNLAAGDPDAALRQYEHLERVLARDLGLSPMPPPVAPARGEAARGGSHTRALLAELAELARRQRELLAELDTIGVPTPLACREC